MKQYTLVPVLVLTAGAAFALGWIARPDQKSSAKAEASTDSKVLTNRANLRPTSGSSFAKSARGPVEAFVSRFGQSGALAPEEMASAIEALRKENDPILRRKLFTELLEQLTPDNAAAAYLALREGRQGPGRFGPGRGGDGEDEIRLLANAWGRLDGAGAVAALTKMREEQQAEEGEEGEGRGRGGRGGRGGDMRSGMDIVAALSGWATSGGVAAAKHVNGIEDERERQIAGFGVVRGMMVNGVDEAMGYIASMPKGEDGGRAQSFYTSMVANEMLEQGTESAKAWVDTISDPDLRSGALSRVAESAVRENLDEAVQWVTKYANDESAQRAISRVADEWAEKDPQAVLTWAEGLPETAKAEAYGQAFQEWARQDPTAAGEYLGTLPNSTSRDAAVEEYAQNVAREEPSAAIQWAETISDQESRIETITDVARTWYRQDQEAATQWLETSGLPEETVKSVTEAPQRGFDRFRGGPGGRRGR